jgi:predicted XRE-type DNA-binding protein|tara:strand:+ start:72 stop:305 length:234 start_codon:yes stop_codon:yes gene_type:complete
MNPMSIISLAMAFVQLNKGQTTDGKKIIKEAMDVIQSLGNALKDKKITNVEKKALVKELKEFTTVTIKAIDNIVIPE